MLYNNNNIFQHLLELDVTIHNNHYFQILPRFRNNKILSFFESKTT